MKKIIAFSAFAVLGVVALSSCKKEYACTCTSTSLTTTEKTGKGKDAEEACNDAAEKVLGIPVEVCVPK